MNFRIKGVSLLGAAVLLAACSENPKKPSGTASVKVVRDHVASSHHRGFRRILPYVPMPDWGPRTVDDVLVAFAPYVTNQLIPYFKAAGVDYPPRALTLVAFKQERKLEVWARDRRSKFQFIRSYPIRAASGTKGPKLRQGDRQVPEGIYHVVDLNPNSNYHLSMRLDYPNEYDLYYANEEGRFKPGNDIFIHGKAVSAGCLAMGDEAIEELFVLAAHVGPARIKVVIAPNDPRLRPLDPNTPGLPFWTPELYREIAGEIDALVKTPPVKVSSAPPARRTDNRLR